MKQRFLRAEYLELRTMLSASQPLVPAVDDVQTSNVDVLTTSADDANGQVASQLTTVAGDFNADNIIDAIDIDMLCAAMGNHVESGFDLTADGLVDKQDMDMLIHDIIGTEYGDANLNGFVSTNDLRYLFNNLFSSSGGWAAGDFSCDGIVDGADFIVWNQYKGVQTPLSTRLLAAGGNGGEFDAADLAADSSAPVSVETRGDNSQPVATNNESTVEMVEPMSQLQTPLAKANSTDIEAEPVTKTPANVQSNVIIVQPISVTTEKVTTSEEVTAKSTSSQDVVVAPVQLVQPTSSVVSTTQSKAGSSSSDSVRTTRTSYHDTEREATARDHFFALRSSILF